MGFRKILFLASLIVAGGCGGTATSPSSTGGGLPFQAGAYQINFIGGSAECGDIKNPQAGTSIVVRLTCAECYGWTAMATGGTSSCTFSNVPERLPLRAADNGHCAWISNDARHSGRTTIPANGTRPSVDGVIFDFSTTPVSSRTSRTASLTAQ